MFVAVDVGDPLEGLVDRPGSRKDLRKDANSCKSWTRSVVSKLVPLARVIVRIIDSASQKPVASILSLV